MENKRALGGMRQPHATATRGSRAQLLGAELRAALQPIIERARRDTGLMQAIRQAGSSKAAAERAAKGMAPELIAAARKVWFEVLARYPAPGDAAAELGAGDPGPDTASGPSAAAFRAWGAAARDLDAAAFLPE